MTHPIEQSESTVSVKDMPNEQLEAQGAKDKLGTEYVNEIMPRGGNATMIGGSNNKGAETPDQMLQKGLSDLGSGNGVKGILQLMRAAQLNPEILRDQRLLKGLHNVVPESAAHSEHYTPVLSTPGTISQVSGRVAPGDQTARNSRSGSDANQLNGNEEDQQGSQAGRQLVERALTDIASGNTVNGILELMQAAQVDPSIMQDARFSTALQTALGNASGSPLRTASSPG